MRSLICQVTLLLVLTGMVGCRSAEFGPTITDDAFYDQRSAVNDVAPAPRQRGESRDANPSPSDATTQATGIAQASADEVASGEDADISDPGRDTLAAVSATRPSGRAIRIGDTTGRYMTIGGVIAEVNGTPIYVDKVLASIERDLRAKALELGPEQFSDAATRLIREHVWSVVQNELVYANALRHLEERDRMLADMITERYRQRKITEAGGSIEVARRQARSEGVDFAELVQAKAREHIFQVYYERKVRPRVEITAAEMREFYNQNRQRLFTTHEQARFRLIRIDPRSFGGGAGGRDQAISRAQALRQRAEAGESFEALASEYNDDERLKRVGGDSGWVQRGAYRLERVEDAVFALQAGQITPIVEDEGAFFIARLEEYQPGEVRPFEAEDVQRRIEMELQSRHLRALRERDEQRLLEDAIIRENREQFDVALQMAMQKYVQWRSESDLAAGESVVAPAQ